MPVTLTDHRAYLANLATARFDYQSRVPGYAAAAQLAGRNL